MSILRGTAKRRHRNFCPRSAITEPLDKQQTERPLRTETERYSEHTSTTMPAPTALKREDAPPADIALPDVADNDDAILLDTTSAFPSEPMAVDADAPMSEDVIDEEGRPKFAPAQDLVRPPRSPDLPLPRGE